MTRRPAVLALALAAACGDRAAARLPATTAAESGPPPARRIDVAAAPDRGQAAGAPHASPIDELVLSPDGAAAVTLDRRGGVRLWPDLDTADLADAEPLVVPAPGARRLSVARRTVAFVDIAGAGHVLALDPARRWRERFATSPTDPLVQLVVLPDGEHTLGLGADRVVRLYDARGAERARLDRAGARPGELHVSADGRRALALTLEGETPVDITALPIAIALGDAPSLTVAGDEVTFDDVLPPFALAPAADAIAWLTPPGNKRTAVIAELTRPEPAPLAADFDAGNADLLGFTGDRSLLVSSTNTGVAWHVTAGAASPLPRPPLRFQAGGQVRLATAADRVVIAAGSWLFAQRPAARTHAYLGYAPFFPTTGALSADRGKAAWLSGGHIFVETLAGAGEVTRIPAAQPPAFRLAFLDDDHLMVLDAQGGLHTLDATSGRTLDSVDAGGVPRSFEVDPARRQILVVPNAGVPHLFTYDADFRLRGPAIAPLAVHVAGLVDGAVWTYDGTKRRTFAADELAAGVSQAAALARGDDLQVPGVPLVGDGGGRLFGWDGAARKVVVVGPGIPGGSTAFELPGDTHVYRVLPSPDGTRIALHTNLPLLALYDTGGRELWARPLDRAVQDVVWSPDSAVIITTGQAGAGLWNAADGTAVRVRCGVWFERSPIPPHAPHVEHAEALLCE